MKVQIVKNVPHPSDEGFIIPLKPLGWWISDETMRLVVRMAQDWENMDDTRSGCNCDTECGPFGENFKNCPYGETHGDLCVFADHIIKSYQRETEDERDEKQDQSVQSARAKIQMEVEN